MKKLKVCSGCAEEKIIWKNHEGKKYCQYCWNAIKFKKEGFKPKKQTPIKPKSKKREVLDRHYSQLRKIFLTKHPMCQIAMPGCTQNSTDVHHTYAGSNRSKYYLVVDTWISTCRSCHDWVHSNPQKARDAGYLK